MVKNADQMTKTLFTTSKDGTKIAFSKTGNGQPLILIDGAFCHRNFGANVKLPKYLSGHFTVYTYDRRGKGESGNTLPYSVEREFEDLQAVINEAGENAFVYGISSCNFWHPHHFVYHVSETKNQEYEIQN